MSQIGLWVNNIVNDTQLRMARAALKWKIADLAARSGVHANTISAFETGKTTPHGPTLAALRRAFEEAGVEFIERGVRLKEG